MAQNEPQRKETPPGPSTNSPSLLFEYQRRSGKCIRLANRIESKLFCPNWNALVTALGKLFTPIVHQSVKLVPALLRVAGLTAGLAKNNGSLRPGL